MNNLIIMYILMYQSTFKYLLIFCNLKIGSWQQIRHAKIFMTRILACLKRISRTYRLQYEMSNQQMLSQKRYSPTMRNFVGKMRKKVICIVTLVYTILIYTGTECSQLQWRTFILIELKLNRVIIIFQLLNGKIINKCI